MESIEWHTLEYYGEHSVESICHYGIAIPWCGRSAELLVLSRCSVGAHHVNLTGITLCDKSGESFGQRDVEIGHCN